MTAKQELNLPPQSLNATQSKNGITVRCRECEILCQNLAKTPKVAMHLYGFSIAIYGEK